ncbi:MAG TPA: hypothetical protein VGG64_26990 [Pirellulales bacterium]|jgi:hypothetical protein
MRPIVIALVLLSTILLRSASGDVPVFEQLPLMDNPPAGAPYIGQGALSDSISVGTPNSTIAADDFELSAPTTVTSITWWGTPLLTPLHTECYSPGTRLPMGMAAS